MPWISVVGYWLTYDVGTQQFKVWYQLAGSGTVTPIAVSAEQFIALSDMLRNEKPVSFNGSMFSTGKEPVGEEEGGG